MRSNLLSVGEFVAFMLYFTQAVHRITSIVTEITEQRILMHQAQRLYHLMHLKPDIEEPSNPRRLDRILGQIEFQNISFHYPDAPNIVENFNLRIEAKERVALVGASGNGKSTILKLLCRFYDPQNGDIMIDGVSIRELSLEQLRQSIGFVFQETYLFGASVKENIRFGNPEATDEDVVAAAKAAFAHDFIVELENGYDTLVGERGVKLSGGQKQRISIGRMFIKNPPMIVLDEATSALDNTSERYVQEALNRLLEGRTTIAVAHRLSTIQSYERIVLMNEGRIVEMGTYEQLMERQGEFYRLVNKGEAV